MTFLIACLLLQILEAPAFSYPAVFFAWLLRTNFVLSQIHGEDGVGLPILDALLNQISKFKNRKP